ncbi:MAG: DNA repair protein RecN [Planctomycetota bacterium]|nr:MAG: DNA repair protein RecN [Planctomycetota bacterium]
MLEQLTIRDLALLRRAGAMPAEGLTVISGETGGGKSLVIQALHLLRGERGKSGLVRRGAKAASVDGVFVLSGGERSEMVRALYLEVLGTELEEDRLVVTRVMDASGRSRARIDGRPVALRDLQRFGSYLLEIHGQGQNRSLMRPEIQTELLDAYAELRDERLSFARELAELRLLDARLRKLREGQRERRERAEFLRYCLDEIAAVDPQEGESEELEREERVLGHLDTLRQGLEAGVQDLYEGEGHEPVIDRVRQHARRISELAEFDERLGDAGRMLEEAGVLLEEGVHEMQSGLARLELDPGRLEELRSRLHELRRLQERFGPDEAGLFEQRARMQVELEGIDDEAQSPERLAEELEARLTSLAKHGESIERARRKAARPLGKRIAEELAELGMDKAGVEVRVVPHEGKSILDRSSELGTCEIELFLAPNPGEAMTPLRETASGGEVARVMLVLKKILADSDQVPVLVFDEADAEIGGRLGLAVGRKLEAVAKAHQVLCVTHLPQIAAFADQHLLVEKRVEEGGGGEERTVAEIRPLTIKERKSELASMTRGDDAVDENALREAGRLMKLARGK